MIGKHTGRLVLLMLVALVLCLAMTATSQAASVWIIAKETIPASLTAGEVLAVGDVVCMKAADGKVWKADADAPLARPAIGLVYRAAAANAAVTVVTRGILAGQVGLTPGADVYLSATAGAFTQTAPTKTQRVGWAATATMLYVDIGKLDHSRKRWATSDAITLTNAGAATITKAVLRTTHAITVTAAWLIYETASDVGTVPKVEVGVDGALDQTVAAVDVTAEQAALVTAALTVAEPAVAVNKVLTVSTVAAGATTNTGTVKVMVEYIIDE